MINEYETTRDVTESIRRWTAAECSRLANRKRTHLNWRNLLPLLVQ